MRYPMFIPSDPGFPRASRARTGHAPSLREDA
jgi:hypothetical protein